MAWTTPQTWVSSGQPTYAVGRAFYAEIPDLSDAIRLADYPEYADAPLLFDLVAHADTIWRHTYGSTFATPEVVRSLRWHPKLARIGKRTARARVELRLLEQPHYPGAAIGYYAWSIARRHQCECPRTLPLRWVLPDRDQRRCLHAPSCRFYATYLRLHARLAIEIYRLAFADVPERRLDD